nr:hypothetical protein GCM10020093_111410 [Planobispora longispora]
MADLGSRHERRVAGTGPVRAGGPARRAAARPHAAFAAVAPRPALHAVRPAEPSAARRAAHPVAGYDRAAFGTYLLDLLEPCLGVEVPASIAGSPQWRAVTEACGDVAAWCESLAAGLVPAEERALAGTVERIVARVEELWTAARAVPALVERRGLDFAASAEVTRVTCAFLTVSRASLERLLEAGSYTAQTRESPTGVRL